MPSTDLGERIYAVGDVHGRYDLLTAILDRIATHSASLPPAKSFHIIFLGDLVDRGPDSARVLGLLYDLQRQTDRIVVLAGNHEEAMLQAIDGDPEHLRIWMGVGGAQTVRSFELSPYRRGDDARDYARRLRSAIPRDWVSWLKRLPITARSGDYFFCHAGVRPGVALRRQTRTDLLWIRDDFLDDPSDHGAVIVHGHSVEPEVSIRANRIGIDTGAYRSGVLTALYLEGDRQETLEARL
ncbi:metallophosphoesterase family protein [Sphingomonas sp. Y38-1Y]|uniref:metallophosphoesterase family protein n=1 Tax=Sphingomonas sp. Y38-1Y TaxID=3078265 RepID=UPI0028E37811|nr:metallophosphoesterase family protein [Sphingomonas sp. Y38-1Y]